MCDCDQEMDTSGLSCPLPILRARKVLEGMEHGQILRIIATDPGSVQDFEAFAKHTGHHLLDSRQAEGKFLFHIRRA